MCQALVPAPFFQYNKRDITEAASRKGYHPMTHDDAIWSYAEEFAERIVGGANKSLPEEIAEKMAYELNKRDWRKVLEKMDTLMTINVADGRLSRDAWDKIRAKLYACLGIK